MYKNNNDSSKSKNFISEETVSGILKFRDDRSWSQFHSPKDLAISINLESAELLEVFQWSGVDVLCEEKKDKIREELADVLIYCVFMADVCGFNMDGIIRQKMQKNSQKYPVDQSYGNKMKYTDLRKIRGSDNKC